MGASQSSNVTNVATNIANTIQNSTSINLTQQNAQQNVIAINPGCNINAKSLSLKIQATTKLRQDQVSNVSGQSSLKNNIAQSAIQSATSKVGSLGIGYASASNAVNMLCNATNTVVNTVDTKQNQMSTQTNSITCSDSNINIRGAVNMTISSASDMTQKLALSNSNVTDISNTVSQSVKQTASATVEGIAGALIAIAILIVAIGWSFGEVATSATSFLKPLITIGVAILIAFIIFLAWFNSWGPFFSKLTPCSTATQIGNGTPITPDGTTYSSPQLCGPCLITDKKPQPLNINTAPIKYTFPLFNQSDINGLTGWKSSSIGLSGASGVCLFDIACISGSNEMISGKAGSYNNAGYTISSLISTNKSLSSFNTKLNSFKQIGIKNPILNELVNLIQTNPIPPLLTDPSNNIKGLASAVSTSMKFINIPIQYQILKGGNISSFASLQGLCTPGHFMWDPANVIPQWTIWGANTDGSSKNCYTSGGSYSRNFEGATVPLGSNNQYDYGLANSNKSAFLAWMLKLSQELQASPIVSKQSGWTQENSENVVSGFVRTMLTYVLNDWLENKNSLPLESSSYIFPWEIISVTPPAKQGVATSFLTEPTATTFPKIVGSDFDFSQYLMLYIPDTSVKYNLLGSINPNTSGVISMVQGVCQNKTYELQHFMSTVGNWIILFIILVALVVIWRA